MPDSPETGEQHPDDRVGVHDEQATERGPEDGPAHAARDDEDEQAGAWLDDAGELPVRPRRRLLTPVGLALLAALAVACGFIGGVLVEKGQGGSASAAGDGGALASRLAGLRGAGVLGGTSVQGGRAGASSGAGPSSGEGSSSSSASGLNGGGATAGAGATPSGAAAGSTTIGQVAYVSGSTLYVTTTEGNTVKVTAAPGASVTKTVKTHIKGIHPGETVLLTGSTRANGAIAAQAIRVGGSGAGAFGGGLLGAAPGATVTPGGTGAAAGSNGAASGQALFGKGG